MICEIQWNTLTLQDWQQRFNKIRRSNILQSYVYAQAVCPIQRQKARWGLIIIDGQEAGLVQILEVGILWNLFHTLMLDRGPLWFEGFGGAAHIKIFFEVLTKQFPSRFGRKRRFIPEVDDGIAAQGLLKQAGLERIENQVGYETLWWDLTTGEDQARAALKGNWRGSLNKAERAGLSIEWDAEGALYSWLKPIYAADKAIRGYGGVSPKLLDNLAMFSTTENPMIIGKAALDGQDIAAVLFLTHGQSATYQIGWSSEEGRKTNAHHLLLWQARSVLQEYGITMLDLGGINDEAEGIKKFKEGTNAKISKLVGQYR